MDPKEKQAIKKCSSALVTDLHLDRPFLYSLYAKAVLTEGQMEALCKTAQRRTKVALLLEILLSRGPNAFTIFKNKVAEDHSWLAAKLEDELKKLQKGEPRLSINEHLNTIIHMLLLLVGPQNSALSTYDQSDQSYIIIKSLSELLTTLKRQCYTALGEDIGSSKAPLHKLIEEKLNQHVKKEARALRELRRKEKQQRDTEKLTEENARLKERLQDYRQIKSENSRYRQEIAKCKKQVEILRSELLTLKEQKTSNVVIESLF